MQLVMHCTLQSMQKVADMIAAMQKPFAVTDCGADSTRQWVHAVSAHMLVHAARPGNIAMMCNKHK
jgi:hypothetical protein